MIVKNSRLLYTILSALLFSVMCSAQTSPKPIDRLSVPGPISFNNGSYSLAWSAHPSADYYKQEYLQKGEKVEKFNSMVMVEVATGAIVLKDVVAAKIAELKSMSPSNPFISYESSYSKDKDEYILDFVITQNSPDGKSALIAERNVYRYKNLPASVGKPGIMLFAISTRAYGAQTKTFLAGLKEKKASLVTAVSQFKLPVIVVNQN